MWGNINVYMTIYINGYRRRNAFAGSRHEGFHGWRGRRTRASARPVRSTGRVGEAAGKGQAPGLSGVSGWRSAMAWGRGGAATGSARPWLRIASSMATRMASRQSVLSENWGTQYLIL